MKALKAVMKSPLTPLFHKLNVPSTQERKKNNPKAEIQAGIFQV